MGFIGVVWGEVLRAAKADRLVPKFDRDLERASSIAHHGVDRASIDCQHSAGLTPCPIIQTLPALVDPMVSKLLHLSLLTRAASTPWPQRSLRRRASAVPTVDFEAIAGLGVLGSVRGAKLALGNGALMAKQNLIT
jgi:hypothetical protein